MIVLKRLNAFYLEDGRSYSSVDSLQNALKDQTITITESLGLTRFDNVIDIRILFWLSDNFYKQEQYKFSSKDDYKKVFADLKQKLSLYVHFVEQAKALTKLYLMINANHSFEYNKKFYLVLKEHHALHDNCKSKLPKYTYDGIENLDDIIKGIHYDFINPTGKILNKGFSVMKFDRKKYIELFKPRKDCHYFLLDFKNFEPSMLNFYIKDYVDEGFYLKNAEKYKLPRDEFKSSFIAWLNGAGEGLLGIYLEQFRRDFPEVESLRNSLKSNRIQNVFGTTLSVDKDYKKMSYLIQSTAGDVVKKVHYGLYTSGIFKDGFRLIFSLFDEFLIEVAPSKKIEDIKPYFELYDFIKIKVQEV